MSRFHYSWFTKMFLWFGFVKNPLMWPGGYNMEIGVSPNPCTIKNTPLEALFVIYVISLVLLPGKYLTKSLQKGVHTVLCAAKMFGHMQALFFIGSLSIVVGHPAWQHTQACIRQIQTNTQSLLLSNWQTPPHTHVHVYTHTLSQQ